VDEGHGLAASDRWRSDRGADEALRAFLGDGLDAEAGGLGEADLLVAKSFGKFSLEELFELLAVLGAGSNSMPA
jgi:hypothetical protein